jgi:hypothetical protein
MKTVRQLRRPWLTALSALALTPWILMGSGVLADDTGPMARDYWLSGEDPVTIKDKDMSGPADYLDLFHWDAPWSSSAAKLKGFKITTQLVMRGTDEQLKTVIEGLKARHIGMSIELGLLVYSDAPPSCGKGSEGIGRAPSPGRPSATERIARRLTALGGKRRRRRKPDGHRLSFRHCRPAPQTDVLRPRGSL